VAAAAEQSDDGPMIEFGTARELAGKTALVTGVTRRTGIGAAIARQLAQAGASVFVTFFRAYDQRQSWGVGDDEPEGLLVALGRDGCQIAGTELDLAEIGAPAELFRRAVQRFGPIDILVNNAAHWEGGGIGDVDAEQLDRHHAVNVRAAVLLCAEFARQKAPDRPGRIVSITSGQGAAPMPGEIAYVVTKAALDALTLTLSSELAGQGITVNAIDPGPTDTGWIAEEQRAQLIAASPTGRIATPDDTARVVRALAGDAAASVTGRIIRVQESGAAAAGPGLETGGRDADPIVPAFSIRPYAAPDRAALCALWSRVFPDDPPWNAPELMIANKLAVQPHLLLVGEFEGALVGAVMAGFDGVRGWIYHLAVAPELRRRGFASQLVRAAERGLRTLGCPKVNLQVRAENQAVVALYQSLGYHIEQRVSMGRRLLAGAM
jgi:3-oxoacyl-[acyl-carrier protein] reductase